MSRSSSGSWSGAAPPGDIIDLDRFMRTARPSPRDAHRAKLVVDRGRHSRKPASSSVTSTEERAPAHRDKPFSHDSGLSDGSYAPRRRRRGGCAENAGRRKAELQVQPKGSSGSLRAFRTVCERALLDQQQQIARVAQLCERLTERRPTTDTSDISSSSRSTGDQQRKDKHRTEECKTYKIIMTKLDEINRLFAARNRSPPQRPKRPESLSGWVSVSDKVVATEPPPASPRNTISPTVMTTKRADAIWKPEPSVSRLVERNNNVGQCDPVDDRARRLAVLRAVTNGPTLDIAPVKKNRTDCPNVLTESVVKCDSSDESSCSGCEPHRGFDLDNPAHLYAQAKRLQALHATHRRARSVESPRSNTLCSICRGYFRSLRQYLATQLLCCPTEPCVC